MPNPREMNRRDVLRTAGLAAAGLALSPFWGNLARAAGEGPTKRVLFFTKSSGFQHSAITRPEDNPDKLSFAEQMLTDLGARHGFEVTCSKDGTIFTPENIAKFDAFAFYTTGDLTTPSDKYKMTKGPDGKNTVKGKLIHPEPAMSPEGKAAFLQAIHDGKGFLAFHSGSDTFHSKSHVKGDLLRNVNDRGEDEFDPYIQMLGGEFIVHGAQQKSTLRLTDPHFPGAAPLKDANFQEEWYSLKNFAPDLHVILVQDTEGMTGPMYQRKAYPETWARMHGKGRVFFTSMGHREDVWQRPDYQGLLVGALDWATGRVDADVKPNIKEVTPEADPKPFAKETPKEPAKEPPKKATGEGKPKGDGF